MAETRKLSKPPIVEAVIDFRVQFEGQRSGGDFEGLHSRLPGYGTPEKAIEASFQLAIGGNSTPPAMRQVGAVFRSTDKRFIIQAKHEGLSFSVLAPYRDFEEMFEGAWAAWVVYRQALNPSRVTRISTRYVNRLIIPNGRDLDEFLTIGPRLPNGTPNAISSYSVAMTIPGLAAKTIAIVRSSLQAAAETDAGQPVLLDLDLIREVDLDPADDAPIQRALSELRPLKNLLFFGSLHEQAMEPYL